jgi:acetate kinase
MADTILVLNAGSSSIKCALFRASDEMALEVHGGTIFVDPVRLDPSGLSRLAKINELAPLHEPHRPALPGAARRRKRLVFVNQNSKELC